MQVRLALSAHRLTQTLSRSQAGLSDPAPDDFIFADGRGTPLRPDRVSKAFRQWVARLGLPRIRLHDLRHACATLMLAGGVPVKVASARLGHSTIKLTLDTYAHVLPAQEAAAAELFDSIVRPQAVGTVAKGGSLGAALA